MAEKKTKKDPLGKLLGEFGPAPVDVFGKLPFVILFAVLGVVGLAVGAFVPSVRLYLMIGGGVSLALAGIVALFLLPRRGFQEVIEIRRDGIRWRKAGGDEDLHWALIDHIDIRRTYHMQSVRTQAYATDRRSEVEQEVYLHSPSNTFHLTTEFLRGLEDPNGLIKMIRKHSGKEVRYEFEDDRHGNDD